MPIIVVSNLPLNTTEQELLELFKNYGVSSITMRGKMGTAFIELEDLSGARSLDRSDFNGRSIRVKLRKDSLYDRDFTSTYNPDKDNDLDESGVFGLKRQAKGYTYEMDRKDAYQDSCEAAGLACSKCNKEIFFPTKANWREIRQLAKEERKGMQKNWFTVDHVLPVERWERLFTSRHGRSPNYNEAKAWGNCRKNWQPMHWGCNSSKGDRNSDRHMPPIDTNDGRIDGYQSEYASTICICPDCPHCRYARHERRDRDDRHERRRDSDDDYRRPSDDIRPRRRRRRYSDSSD